MWEAISTGLTRAVPNFNFTVFSGELNYIPESGIQKIEEYSKGLGEYSADFFEANPEADISLRAGGSESRQTPWLIPPLHPFAGGYFWNLSQRIKRFPLLTIKLKYVVEIPQKRAKKIRQVYLSAMVD